MSVECLAADLSLIISPALCSFSFPHFPSLQTLFAVSLLLALCPWDLLNPHLELCMALVTFSAGVSLLFMLKSILLFDPEDNEALHHGSLWTRIARSKDAVQWDVSRLPSKVSAFYIVLGLGLLWSVLGAALISVAQQHTSTALKITYNAFGAACFTVAAFTTHGLGGHLRYKGGKTGFKKDSSLNLTKNNSGSNSPLPDSPTHRRSRTITVLNKQIFEKNGDVVCGSGSGGGSGGGSSPRHRATRSDIPSTFLENWPSEVNLVASDNTTAVNKSQQQHGAAWKFFQPFKGGTVFVATQAAGWLLYSAALALVLWGIGATTTGLVLGVQAYAVAIGATGVAAQIAIAVSLLAYNSPETVFHVPKTADIKSVASFVAIVILLYLQVHAVVAMFVLSFLTLPSIHAATLWIGGLSVYYAATGFGAEQTGKREWPRFRNWVGTQAERVLPTLLGSFQVLAAPGAKFDREKRYVFGYAPHGLFPIGAAYLPCTPAFKKIVKNAVDPCTLTASVVFQLPFLRDLLFWVGARVVNRSTFVMSLRERGSVIMVPGGQAELVEAYQAAKSKNPALVVCSRHKGFIRLAVQENAALVPVVVFGEVTSLRNAIVMPRLQRATYKLLGFPIPFLMAGRGGILPLPSKTGLRFVIGRPIEPSQVLETLLESLSRESSIGSATGNEDNSTEKEGLNAKCVEEEVLVQALHKEFYSQAQELWDTNKKDFPGYESMPFVLG
jgi:diacylglycerol O-acyltransferase 2, plant